MPKQRLVAQREVSMTTVVHRGTTTRLTKEIMDHDSESQVGTPRGLGSPCGPCTNAGQPTPHIEVSSIQVALANIALNGHSSSRQGSGGPGGTMHHILVISGVPCRVAMQRKTTARCVSPA